MRNITKIYVFLALVVITVSPLPSLEKVALDKTFENGILDEIYSISANFGQRLHIEITDSTGNISFRLLDKQRGFDLKLSFTEDTQYVKVMDISVNNLLIFVNSSPDFKGNVKIYSDGISPSTFYQLGMGLLLLSLGIIAEFILRRPSTSPYLHDEDARVSFRGLIGGIVPFYLLIGAPKMSTTLYRFEQELSYAPDLQFKGLYVYGTQIHVPLIILLIVLTYHVSVKSNKPSQYSVYPIDVMRQYIARITVYLNTLFALSASLYVIALFNGSYSGKRFVWIYVAAFIASFVTLSFFVLLQILITDFVRIGRITSYLFPMSILVYLLIFSSWNIPIYHLLGGQITSISPPFPYLWFYFLEVIVGIAGTVYLNLRLRKSNTFVAN